MLVGEELEESPLMFSVCKQYLQQIHANHKKTELQLKVPGARDLEGIYYRDQAFHPTTCSVSSVSAVSSVSSVSSVSAVSSVCDRFVGFVESARRRLLLRCPE